MLFIHKFLWVVYQSGDRNILRHLFAEQIIACHKCSPTYITAVTVSHNLTSEFFFVNIFAILPMFYHLDWRILELVWTYFLLLLIIIAQLCWIQINNMNNIALIKIWNIENILQNKKLWEYLHNEKKKNYYLDRFHKYNGITMEQRKMF